MGIKVSTFHRILVNVLMEMLQVLFLRAHYCNDPFVRAFKQLLALQVTCPWQTLLRIESLLQCLAEFTAWVQIHLMSDAQIPNSLLQLHK